MTRDELADLSVFAEVAEARSFTRAATRLAMSQSAVSQIVRRLEERLGVRLVARTTRSVAPTVAGEQLLARILPLLREMDESVEALGRFRDTPAGKLRLTATDHAARRYLVPALANFLPDHPDISVEIVIDYGLVDVVANRFDAGVRLGGAVEKDMIAMRIGPEIPMVIVAAPSYLARFPAPTMPQELLTHRCLNLRLPTSERAFDWALRRRGMEVHVRPEGQMMSTMIGPVLDGALAGIGIASIPQDDAAVHLNNERLTRVLPEWEQSLPGYHLYYPNRRNASPAFRLMLDALRYSS
jgi:DNA-binding transcriptional LysR family regulator